VNLGGTDLPDWMNQMKKKIALAGVMAILATTAVAVAPANAASASCSSITKAVVNASGYTKAKAPTVIAYDYKNVGKNAANALGTTIDFGPDALIVSCVSPADITKLSALAQGASKPAMSAKAYMAYMVKQSAGAMTKTAVGGVSDYLDFGNGKEDGLGSLSKAGSLRLDAWVAGKFIFLTFSQPAAKTPPASLLSFIKYTTSNF